MILKKAVGPLFASLLMITLSCSRGETEAAPVSGGILTPLTETSSAEDGSGQTAAGSVDEAVLPLVNPGENYNILALLDGNLDLEQSDEQVLVAIPLDTADAPLMLMIASTNPIRNQYDIVWTHPLSSRTLTGITLRSDDLTGNGRLDIIIAGFDEKGRHVTDVFGVPKNGDIESFTKVFSLVVDGNIDIMTVDRSPGYWSGTSSGAPYSIIVQKRDPDSDNEMDILETLWEWNPSVFAFRQGNTKKVPAVTIQEERIAAVYAGNVEVYEEFLSGAWYRESGSGSFQDMLFFNPDSREIMFFDGSVQEVFTWGVSHRTTAKRLYTRVNNAVSTSMFDTVSVSAEAWDRIELSRTAINWNGSYRRLGAALQEVLDEKSSIPPIVSEITLAGVWKDQSAKELVFDLPSVIWTEDGKSRQGSASFFDLDGILVLQIRFMKPNGAFEETANWIALYEEDRDDARAIRSLSLTPAKLTVDGIRAIGGGWLRFEQIEVLSAAN